MDIIITVSDKQIETLCPIERFHIEYTVERFDTFLTFKTFRVHQMH